MPGKDPEKDDAEMMKSVMKMGEKEGWTRLTHLTLQYVRPTGYGFVTWVQNEWNYIAHRNGKKRVTGKASLLQTATQEVQNLIN